MLVNFPLVIQLAIDWALNYYLLYTVNICFLSVIEKKNFFFFPLSLLVICREQGSSGNLRNSTLLKYNLTSSEQVNVGPDNQSNEKLFKRKARVLGKCSHGPEQLHGLAF